MGIGRTDLTGSDINALKASIATLAELDIEYLVPGHGEIIRGKKVVERNFKMILGEFF